MARQSSPSTAESRRLRRLWSSLLARVRSALSWTLSLPTVALVRRRRRQQEKLDRLLRPLLVETLEPVQDLLQRLEHRATLQEQQLEQMAALLGLQQTVLRELSALTVELLNSSQPSPEEEIARLAGLPPLPTSPRSSVS